MNIHYYLGWFNNGIPDRLCKQLDEDITQRRSLVMISGNPSRFDEGEITERAWLYQANIHFDETHLIDYRVEKAVAHAWIQGASVIFLLGGKPIDQGNFLREYALSDPIKCSEGIVLGASAGAINMGANWVCSKRTGFAVDAETLRDGIGMDRFSVLSHIDMENNISSIVQAVSPLSEEMNVYVSDEDCALRIGQGKVDVMGDVYLVSHSQLHSLRETL